MSNQLIAQDLHGIFLTAYREQYLDRDRRGFPYGAQVWNALSADEQVVYARMAKLLNEKLAPQQPEIMVATATLDEHNAALTVLLMAGTSSTFVALLRKAAEDVIYDSGLEDSIKDELRRTLTVQPFSKLVEVR